MPGPLFNFSAYLGVIIARRWGYHPIVGILCCWFGLFGPGVMLMFAAFPFWGQFRRWSAYRKALSGALHCSLLRGQIHQNVTPF